MEFDTFLVFDAVLLLLGIYLIFQAVRMKNTGAISDWLLPPEELKKCKKKKEYIEYMAIREIAFGAASVLLGAAGILGDIGIVRIPYWRLGRMVLFLAAFGIFWTQMGNAREKFL